MPGSSDAYPFSSKSIVKYPDLELDVGNGWTDSQLDKQLENVQLRLANVYKSDLPSLQPQTLKLQDQDSTLEQIDAQNHSSSEHGSSNIHSQSPSDSYDDGIDIWNLELDVSQPTIPALLTWDAFHGRVSQDHDSQSLRELESSRYDTLLDQLWKQQGHTQLRFLKQDKFLKALANLCLGRGSSFFQWEEDNQSFRLLVQNSTYSGLHSDFTETICHQFISCGSAFRRLEVFCKSPRYTVPTSLALQNAVSEALRAMEAHAVERPERRTTLLELSQESHKQGDILSLFLELVEKSKLTSSEPDLLKSAITLLNERWISWSHLRAMLSNMTKYILRPALRTTQAQLLHTSQDIPQSEQHECPFAQLIPEWQQQVKQIGCCMSHLDRGTLTSVQQQAHIFGDIEISDTWQSLFETQMNAASLEDILKKLLTNGSSLQAHKTSTMSHVKMSPVVSNDPFALDTVSLTMPMTTIISNTFQKDSLYSVVKATLLGDQQDDPDLPPAEALELSLAPLLAVQHRISSYALLRNLFSEHHLRLHFEVLSSYLLMSRGDFAVRLSRSLFDTDQYSGEGRRRIGITSGLRLEDRDVWPPASSELRLVLMGLIAESKPAGTADAIVDCISFAIRDLADDELDSCRDVQSIHALDFLRLVYTASSPVLELVISAAILEKYDQIFRYLLMLLRVHALTQTLQRAACRKSKGQPGSTYQRICIEFHRFTSVLADFAFNTAIGVPLQALQKHVKAIEFMVTKNEYETSMKVAKSVHELSKFHEETLDCILKALLLKRRNEILYGTICNLFSLILKTGSMQDSDEKTDAAIYAQFRNYMRTLIQQLRATCDGSRDEAIMRLEALLVMIDFSAFYTGQSM